MRTENELCKVWESKFAAIASLDRRYYLSLPISDLTPVTR